MKDKGANICPEQNRYVRETLVWEEIVKEEFYRQKLNKEEPGSQRRILEQKIRTYVDALARSYARSHPVSNDELRRAYQEFVENYEPEEILVRHILIDSEEKANQLLQRIKRGADMAVVAKRESLDKTTVNQGGLLSFMNVKSFSDQDFAQMAQGLEKGDIFPKPYKSKFGYHILKLEDKREMPLPSFEKMEPLLLESISKRRANEYLQRLYKNVKTEGSAGTEKLTLDSGKESID